MVSENDKKILKIFEKLFDAHSFVSILKNENQYLLCVRIVCRNT